MSARAAWLGAVALATGGTALVFAGVTASGLFLPGVVLIDAALVLALAAGVLELVAPAQRLKTKATPAESMPMPAPRT